MTVSDNTPPEHLEDLDQRLYRAREKSRTNKNLGSSVGKEQASSYSLALRVGTEMVSALIVGVGIGYFLDYWLETKPWFLVLFFFLGAGAGVLNVYRAASVLGTAPGHTGLTGSISSFVKQQKTPVEKEIKQDREIGSK